MQTNRQFLINLLFNIAAIVAKSKLFRASPLRNILGKIWNRSIGNLGNDTFCFNIEINDTRFQMCGPYRYLATDYYHNYLAEGAYEAAVTAHITGVVQQYTNPRILDVGAHYGWYTLYLAKYTGHKGTVFAFEPNKTIASILKRNLEINGLSDIKIYTVPLSDKHELITMTNSKVTPLESRYMHSITEQEVDMNPEEGKAYALPFDEINTAEALYPKIVKIDVHGVWRKVMDGMAESLQRDIEHLYLELDTYTGDPSVQYEDTAHVISLLRNSGLEVFEIHNFRKRNGWVVLPVDDIKIMQRTGDVMLYALKKK